MKILVIEDQERELKLVTHVLLAAGNDVDGLSSAEEAFEALRKDRPDVVLIDIVLPGMDGLQLVRLLKADPETRDLVLVAVTTYPEEYPKHEALAAGFDAYLPKPVSTRTLSEDLRQLVMTRGEDTFL